MMFSIPWHALLGGMLLGLSAAILMLFSGKVAGISGIVNGLIQPKKGDTAWRAAFIITMILSAVFIAPFDINLPLVSTDSYLLIALAGLLVGVGTRLGNGCTSGHGIVGMGRFSMRSIIATVVFMLSAIVVVYFRQLFGAI